MARSTIMNPLINPYEALIRTFLDGAIKNFTTRVKYKNGPTDDTNEDSLRNHTLLRITLLPDLLNFYYEEGKLDKEKCQNIHTMINSPDRADWLMAFLIIQKIKKHH